ncbi:MAG: hypothetical protein H0X30_12035 [Anaerolineae bacterium]|nr:hypothetical protein [Anaerolineae bacterium]
MNNNRELTKKAVLDAVREKAQQTRPTFVKVNNGPKLLGQFLQKCLKRREISRVAFAQSLDMETELADAILDGVLPDSELHADLLHELAEAVDCEYDRLVQALKSNVETPVNGWASIV